MKREPISWPTPKEGEKVYWRSLDELSSNDEFKSFSEKEFQEGSSELNHPISRKTFMHLMGASFALAGLTACRRPEEKIVPSTTLDNESPVGEKFFSTTFPLPYHELGLWVKSHEGRPTKIEGNPLHPASLGSSSTWAQAALWEMYDPERSKTPFIDKKPVSSKEALDYLQKLAVVCSKTGGQGFHILSGAINSPTLARIKKDFSKKFPHAKWHVHEPIPHHKQALGIQLATRTAAQPVYRFENAKIILSIAADPFGTDPNATMNANRFSKNRSPKSSEGASMNRLYAVESAWSITGTMADHRLILAPSKIRDFLNKLILAIKVKSLENISSPAGTLEERFIKALANDLLKHKGESLIVAGTNQPVEIQAAVYELNCALSNEGLIELYPILDQDTVLQSSLKEMGLAIDKKEITTLLVLGSNPVHEIPGAYAWKEKLKDIPNLIHLGLYFDETAKIASCHIPQAHFLESWGDVYSCEGVYSPIQPLILPLYDGKTITEIVNCFTNIEQPFKKSYELVRQTWLPSSSLGQSFTALSSEEEWHQSLRFGVFRSEKPIKKELGSSLNDCLSSAERFLSKILPVATTTKEALPFEAIILPDYSTYDGRFNNNGWLQELPDPITKIVWENAALLSISSAASLGVKNNDIIRIETHLDNSSNLTSIEAPVFIFPGIADHVVALHLGYGRLQTGKMMQGAGFNAYALVGTEDSSPIHSHAMHVKITITDKKYQDPRDYNFIDIRKVSKITTTQQHYSEDLGKEWDLNPAETGWVSMENHHAHDGPKHHLHREISLHDFLKHPSKMQEIEGHHGKKLPLYSNPTKTGQQWGMVIDLSNCTGCGACTIACQAENNIPIVGKAQVRKAREMHWIRVDRYFSGDPAAPQAAHQPVPCMHCENATCENVCPVAATVHTSDGLNDMAYNRCVGTRYCANNCYYKVRRFNFLDYRGDVPEEMKLMYNPDVTLRARGVMEKCTYCVQRIRAGQTQAKKEGLNQVPDGRITPACAQACPTRAIAFGDINDSSSQVFQLKHSPRNYLMLDEEINTKPRTSYLGRIRNPNMELA